MTEFTKASQNVKLASAEQMNISIYISIQSILLLLLLWGAWLCALYWFPCILKEQHWLECKIHRGAQGCWIKMPLLCFRIMASTALSYRNQLWPLTVQPRLDEKIMDPWLWCTHFHTVPFRLLMQNPVFSTGQHKIQSPVWILIIGYCLVRYFTFSLLSSTSLQLCAFKRILKDVIHSPDPNRPLFYIVHDRVLWDHLREFIVWRV